MSVLDHPDDLEAPNIQVWNNAAFDKGESGVRTLSWSIMQDLYKNPCSESFQIDCGKENLCPASVKYSVSVDPLNNNGAIENSQGKPFKTPSKSYGIKGKEEEEEVICKERNIDEEIEETEREINRLSMRLKALQIEKAEQNAARTVQRGGRFVPIKSIVPKMGIQNSDGVKMFEDASVERKIGLRGKSLGPSEIYAGVGFRRQGKTELTPIQQMKSRRQSCLPKLPDIDEAKAKNRGRNGMSLSPKSRRTLIKAQTVRQPATTIVSKRPAKKDGVGVVELIQPKKLFKDVEKSAPPTSTKKPLRTGRIVASRYNQTSESAQVATENRKTSLPGNCKDDGSSRSSSELCRSKAPQSRVKKRWEIPSEIMILQQEMEEGCCESPVSKLGDMLPRIRTTRCSNTTPRDSGPAKRVAELIESNTNFFADTEMEASICQKLNFAEDEEISEFGEL